MTKISDKQKAIDKAWAAYKLAMDACETLSEYLEELSEEHGVDVDDASEVAYNAHSALEKPYSEGDPILPPHSLDGGKA